MCSIIIESSVPSCIPLVLCLLKFSSVSHCEQLLSCWLRRTSTGYKMSSFRKKNDAFYVILKRKYSFHRDSNPPIHGLQSERSTTELADLLMNGHKNSIYQVQNTLLTNQSSLYNCHKMTNYCEQYRTNCCVKISATLTLASTHVFLIKMCQKCYNRIERILSVVKKNCV